MFTAEQRPNMTFSVTVLIILKFDCIIMFVIQFSCTAKYFSNEQALRGGRKYSRLCQCHSFFFEPYYFYLNCHCLLSYLQQKLETEKNNKLAVAFAFSFCCVLSFHGLLINRHMYVSCHVNDNRYTQAWPIQWSFQMKLYQSEIDRFVDQNWSITHTHTDLSGLSLLRLVEPDFLIDNFLKQQFGVDSTRNLFVILVVQTPHTEEVYNLSGSRFMFIRLLRTKQRRPTMSVGRMPDSRDVQNVISVYLHFWGLRTGDGFRPLKLRPTRKEKRYRRWYDRFNSATMAQQEGASLCIRISRHLIVRKMRAKENSAYLFTDIISRLS